MNALILTGGKSRRMGEDKFSLRYREKPQYLRLRELLNIFFSEVFFSVSTEQAEFFRGFPHLTDREENRGPMMGLYSAFLFKKVPWLTVAVDMPFLSGEAVLRLKKACDPRAEGTIAYSVARSGEEQIEPLFSLYHPSLFPDLEAAVQSGNLSLKALLSGKERRLNKVYFRKGEVRNINCKEDFLRHREQREEKTSGLSEPLLEPSLPPSAREAP